MSQQKPEKRVVTEREYVRAERKRVFRALYGIFVCLVAISFVVLVFAYIGKIMDVDLKVATGRVDGWEGVSFLCFAVLCIVFGCLACMSGLYAARTLKEVAKTNPALLLTRANTADLPAFESLVRASQAPIQAQKSILLRAATETSEKYEEQLLRASSEGHE